MLNLAQGETAILQMLIKDAPLENTVYISAKTGQGLSVLISKIEEILLDGKRRITYRIPNGEAGALNMLYKYATVEDVQYGAEYIEAIALADAKARGMMKKYAIDDTPEPSEDDWD